MTEVTWRWQFLKRLTEAYARFPGEIYPVQARDALVRWETLRYAGRGAPVIVDADMGLLDILEPYMPYKELPGTPPWSVAETLERASDISYGDVIVSGYDPGTEDRLEESEMWANSVRKRHLAVLQKQHEQGVIPDAAHAPDVWEWPPAVMPSVTYTTEEYVPGGHRPHEWINIIFAPTDDWTTIPAHLNWGSRNSCPSPAQHVVAFRCWRDAFGVELVAISRETYVLKASRRPTTWVDAMDLAKDLYRFAPDGFENGMDTLPHLAATLMANDWWYFWWD